MLSTLQTLKTWLLLLAVAGAVSMASPQAVAAPVHDDTDHDGAHDALPLDTVLARMDAEISELLDAMSLDQARQLIDQALAMDGVEQSEYYITMRHHLGTYYKNSGDFDTFKRNRLELLPYLPVDYFPEMDVSIPMDLGVIYRREGQNDSALYYYDQALQAAVKQGDVEWQAAINLNVGILYFNLNHLDQAEDYLDRAVAQSRQVDDGYTEMCALQSDAAVKVMLHKHAEAAPLLRQAYALAQEAEMADWQLRCITTMLSMFDLTEQRDSATFYVKVGNDLLPQLPPMNIIAVGYLTARANHYGLTGQWAEAIADYEALMATPTAAMRTATVFEHIARCYSHLGRWQEAFSYMDSARIQADSAAKAQLTAQMADFNVKYRTMEKDFEINRLHTQRLWLAIAAVTLMLVAAVAWLVYRQRRQRREAQMRISTLESERQRIARELHDGLCNDLLALEMQLAFAPALSADSAAPVPASGGLPAGEGASPAARLRAIREQARQLSHQLMPPAFDSLSVAQLLRHYADALDRATPLNVTLTLPDGDVTLPPQTSHDLYRIVQEQTANIVKGATATTIDISILRTSPSAYRLTIADDGKPADTDAKGLGHRTLQDRVTAMAAQWHSTTDDGKNIFVLDF